MWGGGMQCTPLYLPHYVYMSVCLFVPDPLIKQNNVIDLKFNTKTPLDHNFLFRIFRKSDHEGCRAASLKNFLCQWISACLLNCLDFRYGQRECVDLIPGLYHFMFGQWIGPETQRQMYAKI